MPANFFTRRDGHDRPGYIAAREGFWHAMEFRYRICTHHERFAIEDAQQAPGVTSAQRSAIVREAVACHLTSWDQKDARGKELPRTAEILATVECSFLIDRLYNIVIGYALPDERPAAEATAEPTFDPAVAIASRLEGQSPGVTQADRDEKN